MSDYQARLLAHLVRYAVILVVATALAVACGLLEVRGDDPQRDPAASCMNC